MRWTRLAFTSQPSVLSKAVIRLCGCASLVEEHQPCRIEIWLKGEPSLAPDSHILALLFAGVGSLFLNVTSWRR